MEQALTASASPEATLPRTKKVTVRHAARFAGGEEATGAVLAAVGAAYRGHFTSVRPHGHTLCFTCTDSLAARLQELARARELAALGPAPEVQVSQISRVELPSEQAAAFKAFLRSRTVRNALTGVLVLDLSNGAERYEAWVEKYLRCNEGQLAPQLVQDLKKRALSLVDLGQTNVIVEYLAQEKVHTLLLEGNKLSDLHALTCPTGLKNAGDLRNLSLASNELRDVRELDKLRYVRQLSSVIVTDNPVVKTQAFVRAAGNYPFKLLVIPRELPSLPRQSPYRLFKEFYGRLCGAVCNGDSSALDACCTLQAAAFGLTADAVSQVCHVITLSDREAYILRGPANLYLREMSSALGGRIIFPGPAPEITGIICAVVQNPYCQQAFSEGSTHLIQFVFSCSGRAELRTRRTPAGTGIPLEYTRSLILVRPYGTDMDMDSVRVVSDVAHFRPATA
ncbi:hypothetical protein GMRT_13935 [Giardia muris]|uniref:Uncharacterized protein n=1 Tax=Giardia muris TaxID=5742 RepID=A0A4Z1T241_GIAMU|nr:hypothetical protein GMRT_13935 [Giardia muris]|eukprot:TNJ26481.1 hypothetical protein GMRT_13935 [Giardia muris]